MSVCISSEEEGSIAACARERPGEAPQVIVSGCLHGAALTWHVSPGEAVALGKGLVALGTELLGSVEQFQRDVQAGFGPGDL